MQLLIDAGNTRVKWALIEAQDGGNRIGNWLQSGAVLHAQLDTLGAIWRQLPIERAVICNVAGSSVREQLQHALSCAVGINPVPLEWFVSRAHCSGVSNGYRQPTQLGADRFASLIGARALFPQSALLVVTCGTATTIDALTDEGQFVGGMIMPGLGLMASSLARNTAQLPQVGTAISVPQLFADHTDAAIVSGCINAQTGAIERAMASWQETMAATGQLVRCVLSGGAASMIAPHLSISADTVDNLVLLGLHRVTMDSLTC